MTVTTMFPAAVRPGRERKVVTNNTPTVAILSLSHSFSGVWDELCREAGARAVVSKTNAPPDGEALALIVAAGGAETDGLDLVAALRGMAAPVFLIGASPSHRFGVEAIRRGAADYFALPEDLDLLRRILSAEVDAARARGATTDEVRSTAFAGILGESAAMRETLRRAARVADHGQVTVLIQGETGTGKELLARAIHDHGARRNDPFVPVNCAAIPHNLLESELFGHERGAFTDAHREKPGLFEEADGGTLFLDEIGHLPIALQSKILRALEDRTVRRVGGARAIPVDARIVSATNVRLEDAVRGGTFREDLYYRLNVVTLTLPPLRDRGDDVDLLANAFMASLTSRYGLRTPNWTSALSAALHAHRWPGNVRELRHALERALLLSPPGTIDPAELGLTPSADRAGFEMNIPFPATLREITHTAAAVALDAQRGNKSAAARMLGISRTRLQRLLDRGDE